MTTSLIALIYVFFNRFERWLHLLGNSIIRESIPSDLSNDLAPLYAMKPLCVSGFKAANIRQCVAPPGAVFVWSV
jgi:hypothetical protein